MTAYRKRLKDVCMAILSAEMRWGRRKDLAGDAVKCIPANRIGQLAIGAQIGGARWHIDGQPNEKGNTRLVFLHLFFDFTSSLLHFHYTYDMLSTISSDVASSLLAIASSVPLFYRRPLAPIAIDKGWAIINSAQ